jgi:hypothetical protein
MSRVGLQLQLRVLLQGHSPLGARRRPASAGQMSEEALASDIEKQRTLKALGGFPF